MRYEQAVATAPPGSDRFRAADLSRLCRTTLNLLVGPVLPLGEVGAALGGQPETLAIVASALTPGRRRLLIELAGRPMADAARSHASWRVVRGGFWHLAYELAPDLWDRLASAEPIAPQLIADLPVEGRRVLDVAAGSGRLTRALGAAATLVAVEPCPTLRQMLRDRLPAVLAVAGVGHHIPVMSGWADLVASCATFGPHYPLGGERVRAELERCARPGGYIALVAPEDPEWWARHGYELREYPQPAARTDAEVEGFFGKLDPPHTLLLKRK